MSKKPQFDPDKAFIKVRGMGSIHYEQNGHKFNSGYVYIGPVDGKPAPKAKKDPEKKKATARERARAKIAQKKGEDPLDGYRPTETPDAVTGAKQEDEAARQAEEHA